MTAPAVADTNWLEPPELYLALSEECKIDRPIYQGDVFQDVTLPKLPKRSLTEPDDHLQTVQQSVMVVPHPCQCYYGDKLRPFLTVAPVKLVESYENFGDDRAGAKDKFALPDLPVQQVDGSWVEQSCVADFGRLISVPSNWLKPPKRVCCLTHRGLGLLAKRVLGFQLRDRTTTLYSAMAYVQAEWNESFLMQAWVRKYESLRGFTQWLRSPQLIKAIDAERAVVPADYRDGALDALLEAITGEAVD
jgi:hypothetical protein